MEKLKNAIIELAHDTENPEKNYNLGLLYEEIGQTASAITYFFRAAERCCYSNTLMAYECLLRTALCYERQGNRVNTVKRVLQHAICLLPYRPEGLFLLARLQERTRQYVDGYQTASTAILYHDWKLNPIPGVEYPGIWGFTFEKAVCAWWWGKNMESRFLFLQLAHNHRDGFIKLDETHYNSVQNNLCNIGCGPVSVAYKQYSKDKIDRLNYWFVGYTDIERNYSQVYQDMFVLTVLDGNCGTYYEIGGGDPFHGNNTALLETKFDWKGISFEWNPELVERYRAQRKNPIYQEDATKVDHDNYLKKIANADGVVDYLQLDCEPSKTTFQILTQIPFEKYKFRVITYEHDHYVDMTGIYRERSRKYLQAMGYELIVNDVSPDGTSTFEDWWVHPELVDIDRVRMMKTDITKTTHIEQYFLSEIK